MIIIMMIIDKFHLSVKIQMKKNINILLKKVKIMAIKILRNPMDFIEYSNNMDHVHKNIDENSLYCLKCRKNTESKVPKVVKTQKGKPVLLSNCAVCGSEKSRIIKDLETSGFLSSFDIMAGLNRIPLVGTVLF